MASAQSGQIVSGAAQGATTGFAMGGGPWGAVIGGIIGGFGGLISGAAADAQFANQTAWAQYNNQMRYDTAMYNIDSSLAIAGLNAMASMQSAQINSQAAMAAAAYNANIISATVQYNTLLQNEELSRVWQAEDLDLEQLELYRQRERGAIVADQAASGTVIDEGSNAEVVISQDAQRAMDANIIMYNADAQAADIQNSIAQGRWQGQVAISQTMWEGQMSAYTTMANAKIQTGVGLLGAQIQATANRYTAEQGLYAGNMNIFMGENAFSAQNTQNMISGLFQAGGSFATGYFANKVPTPTIKNAPGSAGPNTQWNYGGNLMTTLTKPNVSSIAAPGSAITGDLNR